MKSVLQALFRLTMAFGNLIDIWVMLYFHYQEFPDPQYYEFLFFAILMLVDMFILALMARKYSYKEETR